MRNKKVIIIAVIVVLLCAIGFSIYKVRTSYLFNLDGTIPDGKKDLINKLESVKDEGEKRKQIDFSVEHNIITQEEADELY